MKIGIMVEDLSITLDGEPFTDDSFASLKFHPLIKSVCFNTHSGRGEVAFVDVEGIHLGNQQINMDQFNAMFGGAVEAWNAVKEREIKQAEERTIKESEAAIEASRLAAEEVARLAMEDQARIEALAVAEQAKVDALALKEELTRAQELMVRMEELLAQAHAAHAIGPVS